MLVFARVSSMKTRWPGTVLLSLLPRFPLAGDVSAVLFAGVQHFCKALIKTDRYIPYSMIGDLNAPPMQFGKQFAERRVGLLGEACLQPVGFPHQDERTSATRRAEPQLRRFLPPVWPSEPRSTRQSKEADFVLAAIKTAVMPVDQNHSAHR